MNSKLKKITPLKTKNNKQTPIKSKIIDLETKRSVQYIYTSVKIDPHTKYHCWWCTLPIENKPIGCPLKYESAHTYYSDGIFCSFNCVKAYILDQKNDTRFSESIKLLSHIYCYVSGTLEPVIINPSPPWKFLKQHAGHLTIEQYKQYIDRIVYIEKGIVQMKPVVILYEEEEKF
jgi:hypothetical protein